MNTEPAAPVQLAATDVARLLAAIEFQLEHDATLSSDDRNDLDALFQHLDRTGS